MTISHSVRLVLIALMVPSTLGFTPLPSRSTRKQSQIPGANTAPPLSTSLSKNKFPGAIFTRKSALFDSSPVSRYEGDLDTDVLYVKSKFPINAFDIVSIPS